MSRTLPLFACLLLGTITPLAPIAAEEVAERAQIAPQPAHFDLIEALRENVDQDAMLDAAVAAAIQAMYDESEEFRQMEAEAPGLFDAMMVAARPILQRYNARIVEETKPKLAALLAELVTPEEAANIASFYRSPMGKKLINAVKSNASFENRMRGIAERDDISASSVAQDQIATNRAAMNSLTDEEKAEIEAEMRKYPEFMKLRLFQLRSVPINHAAENTPMTQAEERAFEEVMMKTITAYLSR